MTKSFWLLLACLVFLVAVPCMGAEIGMITLVDGKPKVLRGTAWFGLSEGVRIRDGDTIDVPDKSQFQLELIGRHGVSIVSTVPDCRAVRRLAESAIGWKTILFAPVECPAFPPTCSISPAPPPLN